MAITQTKQQIHSEEVKKRILDKAREMFTAYGVENVSMKELAGELGVTTGTIYHHFESKDDILRHIAMGNARQYFSNLDKYREMPSVSDAIRLFFSSDMFDRVREDGFEFTRYRVMNLLKPSTKNRMTDFLAELIGKGIASGELRGGFNAEEIAWLLMTAHRESCYEYVMSGGDEAFLQRGLDQIDLILRAFSA